MENKLVSDKQKIDFALRQVVELMDMFGLAGLEQEMNGYNIKIILSKEKAKHEV